MRAARIHEFGGPEAVVIDEIPVPVPSEGEVLVRVKAAGVGPWDAVIREGQSRVAPQPPLTLGSDLAGVIESLGPGVSDFRIGDEVFGVTNPQFCGAQAEFAVARTQMLAPKPISLSFVEAAAVPVVAVTAWQMLHEYAQVEPGQTVIVLGAMGNVGFYLLRLARAAGVNVIGVGTTHDLDGIRAAGAKLAVDSNAPTSLSQLPKADAILDTVGGGLLQEYAGALKPQGRIVSVVSIEKLPLTPDVQQSFFYVDVTTSRLRSLDHVFEAGIETRVGSVLPLAEVRMAHEMLAGAPHAKGKILLEIG